MRFLLYIILSFIFNKSSCENCSGYILKHITILFRHGARAPIVNKN
jgi:hypothetical protein